MGEVITIIEVLGNTGSFIVFAVDLLHKSIVGFVEVVYFCSPAYVHMGKSYKCCRMIMKSVVLSNLETQVQVEETLISVTEKQSSKDCDVEMSFVN